MANVQDLMTKLGITEEQALELIAYDKAVDRGEKTEFDLSKEQQAVAKKMTITHDRKVAKTYDLKPRARKENATKGDLIAKLAEFMQENAENVVILNKERQISFQIGENMFELTLVQKRKPKN
jgi:hypothetical protein